MTDQARCPKCGDKMIGHLHGFSPYKCIMNGEISKLQHQFDATVNLVSSLQKQLAEAQEINKCYEGMKAGFLERASDYKKQLAEKDKENIRLCQIVYDDRTAIFTLSTENVDLHKRVRRLREGLEKLANRIEFVTNDPSYIGVWTINQLHTGPYGGPCYDIEFNEAKALLEETKEGKL
mgnify:FL=1